MRFAVTPCQPINMKVAAAVRGSETATVNAARKSQRRMNRTRMMNMIPWPRAVETVRMHACIRLVRS